MISLLRIDERLIHGQVAYSWTMNYKSQALMVVTKEPKNKLETMTLEMACPRNLRCFILTVPEAVETLNKYNSKKIFVVTDSPEVVLELAQAGIEIPSVNVGGIYHKEDRVQLTKTVFVDDTMKQTFGELHDLGIELEIRATPTDKSVDLISLIK